MVLAAQVVDRTITLKTATSSVSQAETLHAMQMVCRILFHNSTFHFLVSTFTFNQ